MELMAVRNRARRRNLTVLQEEMPWRRFHGPEFQFDIEMELSQTFKGFGLFLQRDVRDPDT